MNLIFLSQLGYNIQIWPNFDFMMSPGLLNFQIVENDKGSSFLPQNIYIYGVSILGLPIIVWSQYIALKLL